MQKLMLLLLAMGLLLSAMDDQTRPVIARDEQVVFFPTWGRQTDAGWNLRIHGWIFEPEESSLRRGLLIGTLRRGLRLEAGESEALLFSGRARAFLVDNERNQQVAIRLADIELPLAPSGANGHFTDEVLLSLAEADRLAPPNETGGRRIEYRAVTAAGDDRAFTGQVHLLSEQGLSVISDIDDTIKISDVQDRRRMLRRTFLEPFQAAPGMSDLYAAWAKQGASFHYVTASPWQLYLPLAEFTAEEGFPPGTFHMKMFRARDRSLFNLFADPDATKRLAILPLIAAFPQRRFVLVGDSGQRDPEIYGQLFREYPAQITRIFIRDVTGQKPDDPRYQAAFRDVPADRWIVFSDPAALAEHELE
jgi:hypothetical protein